MRVGIGYDVHPLTQARRLVLGGVVVPFERGLNGWSDADVLTHAVIDALLGAAGMGDIGSHFPPGAPEYKDISSLILLEKARDKVMDAGWQVGNIDATIITERPIIKEYVGDIRQQLGRALGIDAGQVSIKAKTSEKMGFIGREEGMAACAVALIESGVD